MPTFEELNAMTKIELIDFASKKKVPNFKKSWSKKEMIENICNHLDCDKPAKRGRSRSRSPSVKRSTSKSKSRSRSRSKSAKAKSAKAKSTKAKSKSRSRSRSKSAKAKSAKAKSAKAKSKSRSRSRSKSAKAKSAKAKSRSRSRSKSAKASRGRSRSSSKSRSSSPSPSDLSKMKVAELRELAKKMGIKGAAKKKDDLIDQIKKEMKSSKSSSKNSSKSSSKSPSKSKKQSSRSSKKQDSEIPSFSEEELNGMTITNLKILAKKLGIKGSDKYKSTNKGDLIKEIMKNMGSSSKPSSRASSVPPSESSSRASSVPPSESSSRASSVPPSESSSRESSVSPQSRNESDFEQRKRVLFMKLMEKMNEESRNRISENKDTSEEVRRKTVENLGILGNMKIKLGKIEEEVEKNGETDQASIMLEQLIDDFDDYVKTGDSEKYKNVIKISARKSKKQDTDEVIIDGKKVSGDSQSIEGLKSVLAKPKPIDVSLYDVEDKRISLPPKLEDSDDEEDLIGNLKGLREEEDDIEKLDQYQKELLKCLNMTKKK